MIGSFRMRCTNTLKHFTNDQQVRGAKSVPWPQHREKATALMRLSSEPKGIPVFPLHVSQSSPGNRSWLSKPRDTTIACALAHALLFIAYGRRRQEKNTTRSRVAGRHWVFRTKSKTPKTAWERKVRTAWGIHSLFIPA
ncbi:hypothetical protein LX36DRAFT_473004 [Colletotrichum falcatum]|nr:hypothetical protein LX36DRAFT_473004 [Colletotrichum falcatum]